MVAKVLFKWQESLKITFFKLPFYFKEVFTSGPVFPLIFPN